MGAICKHSKVGTEGMVKKSQNPSIFDHVQKHILLTLFKVSVIHGKDIGPDCVSVVVLKNCKSEL